jgi:SAM-dependent methyltransferase
MGTIFQEIKSCRLCGSSNLSSIINLGMIEITSYFPQPEEKDPEKAPLHLILCEACTLLQLQHTVDQNFLFGNIYGYRTSLNEEMVDHVQGLAKYLEYSACLNLSDSVLDIGCNDGTFLNQLSQKGYNLIGIDPNASDMSQWHSSEIYSITDFFSASYFVATKFKLVVSIAMFYDVSDPMGFAKEVKSILHEDGVWFLEQSYVLDMLMNFSFDTICHEHLMYYSVTTLDKIMKMVGLEIIDIIPSTANGGSIGLLVGHTGKHSVSSEILRILTLEAEQLQLLLERFVTGLGKLKVEICSFLNELQFDEQEIWCIGASTKGNTILNYLGLDRNLITAIADKNPLKNGRVTPGTRIPIRSAKSLNESNCRYALVLPWHFKKSIVESEREFLQKGGKLIFPLPQLEIVEYDIFRKKV